MNVYPIDVDAPVESLKGGYLSIAKQLLNIHAASGGRGSDPYDPSPRVHPMAEGKYLSSVAALVNAGLLSSQSSVEVERAIDRIEESAIHFHNGDSLGWGLNFAWKDHDVSQAFVITSALVLRGLCEISLAVPQVAQRARELIFPSLEWLTSDEVLVEKDGYRLPKYGTGDPTVVNNVVAQWSRALSEAPGVDHELYRLAVEGARYVESNHIEGVGWQYSEDNNVVDLVHTAYIAEALLPLKEHLGGELDIWISEALLIFGEGATFADTCRVLSSREALRLAQPSAATRTRVVGRYALVGFQRPARDWSVGALLSVACDLACTDLAPFWLAESKRISRLALSTFSQVRYPRHAMHGAEGIAKYASIVENLRSAERAELPKV